MVVMDWAKAKRAMNGQILFSLTLAIGRILVSRHDSFHVTQSPPQSPRSFWTVPGIETSGLDWKPAKKTAKSHWRLKLVHFSHNLCRTRRIKPEPGFPGSGFGSFWIRPEPMRFPTAGQGDAGSGDEIACHNASEACVLPRIKQYKEDKSFGKSASPNSQAIYKISMPLLWLAVAV